MSLLCSIFPNFGDAKTYIPVQSQKYSAIYIPKSDIFPKSASVNSHLKGGLKYEEWIPNDHALIRAKDGKWHIFGITHPKCPLEYEHDGENLLFHAISQSEYLEKSLVRDSWKDEPKILPPDERPNEISAIHSPTIFSKDNLFFMVYGHSPIRLAVSQDLAKWIPKGELFRDDNGARDPHIYFENGIYYIFYCTENKVGMRESKDLKNWSSRKIIFESEEFEPESPFFLKYKDKYYLFVCSWNGINATNDIPGAYQSKTYVYAIDKLGDHADSSKAITILNAHAPEIIQDGDKWYITSAEYPEHGINIDRLHWE